MQNADHNPESLYFVAVSRKRIPISHFHFISSQGARITFGITFHAGILGFNSLPFDDDHHSHKLLPQIHIGYWNVLQARSRNDSIRVVNLGFTASKKWVEDGDHNRRQQKGFLEFYCPVSGLIAVPTTSNHYAEPLKQIIEYPSSIIEILISGFLLHIAE
jgi:hypothetical protein